MSPNQSDLLNVLTLSEPLGPIDHMRIRDDFADDLIYHKITLFSEVNNKPHMLFLGRKGAGKSALLREIRLGTRKKGRRSFLPQFDRPIRGRDYVIDVGSWEHFHQIVRNVNRQFRTDDIIDELIPAEYFVDLWHQMLWDEIIQYFYNFAHEETTRHLLDPVDKYVNVDGFFEGAAHKKANELFDSAQQSILQFLDRTESKLYFLFDSMDNYPVRNETFSKILSGLFQGLTKINDDSPRIVVSFCIPEEIEGFIAAGSANLMKDLSSSTRIRWKPIDLIRIVAHRLRLSSAIYDHKLYKQIERYDFSGRDDLHRLFSLILPPTLTNLQGTEEDPLAYIIRHTQLLPRHVLAIFNASLSLHYKNTKTFTGMSEDAVRSGVSAVQKLIATQILMPYEHLFPKLLTQCRTILPDLDPICDYRTLKKIEGRFHRLIEDDAGLIWNTLFEMGVLGRSTGLNGVDNHDVSKDDRYCYGQFHFNIDGSFGLATDGEYCFHPVFTRAFGMVRRSTDARVVYPANIKLTDLYAD